MLFRRQDIAVLLFYYCGYSKIRNYLLKLQHKPVTRFVVYHDIPPESVKCFEANLRFLKHNTNVVSFDDFISNRLSFSKINVVITFDDGFKSWIIHAVPILKKLVLPATFFISSGFIGLSKEDELSFIKSNLLLNKSYFNSMTGGLSRDDVKKMADLGFTIGGHTSTHCILSTVKNRINLRYEIAEDKAALEKLTGQKINYFAYPSGVYHNPTLDIQEVLCEAGYKGAVTTVPGFNNFNTNPFLLYRELTASTMSAMVFKARVYGNYDAVQWLKKVIKIH
jgi:peptidoglycan/xylan/chitin deacetylase (PgdA/CDA1 family)